MAIAVGVRIWRDALSTSVEVPNQARYVGFVLAHWMSKDGDRAFPGLVRLSAACVLSERQTDRHLRALLQFGYLWKESGGQSHGFAPRYRACIPDYRWDDEAGRLLTDDYQFLVAERKEERQATRRKRDLSVSADPVVDDQTHSTDFRALDHREGSDMHDRPGASSATDPVSHQRRPNSTSDLDQGTLRSFERPTEAAHDDHGDPSAAELDEFLREDAGEELFF